MRRLAHRTGRIFAGVLLGVILGLAAWGAVGLFGSTSHRPAAARTEATVAPGTTRAPSRRLAHELPLGTPVQIER